MEYFILNEGVKQGPFDVITMIKKVKNGMLTETSMISEQVDGPYREAVQVEEVAKLVREHANPSAGSVNSLNIKMTLAASFQEGIELWVRRILDYTVISGIIIAAGFGFKMIFLPFTGVVSIWPTYISTVLVIALFFEFCYYVLETKRSQRVNMGDFLLVIKRTLPQFMGISILLSTFVLAYGISLQAGLVATLVVLIIMTVFVFTPFIATDSHMGVLRSGKLSMQKIMIMGLDNFGVILAIVSINLFAAILPGMLLRDLLGLGLFISLPITISALAYIYDQVFV